MIHFHTLLSFCAEKEKKTEETMSSHKYFNQALFAQNISLESRILYV